MTPGARIAAAIEVLSELDTVGGPLDAVLASYFKARRFFGSKDRAAVAERVYGVYRGRARLEWHLARVGVETPDARSRVIAALTLLDRTPAAQIGPLFQAGQYAPAPLTSAEQQLAERLTDQRLEPRDMPERVRVECPEWAEASLRTVFGESFAAEMIALCGRAPLDLRANALKASRDEAHAALAEDGILTTPTPLSPWGLRVDGRPPVSATRALKDGLVDVQDEGSQILALVTDARPGMQVVDFCAGAGGKTLALAATMANKGRIVACDISADRLARAAQRLRRAGVHNAERRVLSSERDPWVKRHKAQFDRVLVDAPCTGTGTWRRNPDARWSRGGPDLAELIDLQGRILASAARLVKPGGRLVYSTCSLLHEEDEDVARAFLAAHPRFRIVPVGSLLPAQEEFLRLTPRRHGTDGFFAAVMEVTADATDDAQKA